MSRVFGQGDISRKGPPVFARRRIRFLVLVRDALRRIFADRASLRAQRRRPVASCPCVLLQVHVSLERIRWQAARGVLSGPGL